MKYLVPRMGRPRDGAVRDQRRRQSVDGPAIPATRTRPAQTPPSLSRSISGAIMDATMPRATRIAGLSLPRAVRLAADASANARIRDYVRRLCEHQLTGAPVSELLAACPHMTPELVATLVTAEETGDYGPLSRLAELYEDGFR